MNPNRTNHLMKQLVRLAVRTANETADLLNNGDPFAVWKTEPGSQGRAVELRAQAKELQELFESISNEAERPIS